MQTNTPTPGLLRRTIDDLIVAEMFLVQATIESATAIGDGLSILGTPDHLSELPGATPADTIGAAPSSASQMTPWSPTPAASGTCGNAQRGD